MLRGARSAPLAAVHGNATRHGPFEQAANVVASRSAAQLREASCHVRVERRSAFIQFAHGVFDMLAKQSPLLRRHMAVTLTFAKFRRWRGGAHDGRRRRACRGRAGERVALQRQRAAIKSVRGAMVLAPRRLCLRVGRDGQGGDSAGDGDRDDPRSHARQRASHRHLVPFVMRQPAYLNLRMLMLDRPSSAREWCYGMKYPPNSRDS